MAESKTAIYGAIAANVAIAVTKFIVAGITGSSAMLSEGVHSLVDTGNDALLLVGMRRSELPASQEHPFGHGKELYFWSLIVGVLVFGLGGGVSLYEGISHLRSAAELTDPFWNYVVLAVAAVFEGSSFTLGWRAFSAQRGDLPLWRALVTSKDPSAYTVVAEDGAALAGLAIAAGGVYTSHHFQMPMLDGVASILIGILLAGVAIVLIQQSRGLLVGEGVRPETAEAIRRMVREEALVRDVGPILSMYIGADEVLVTTSVVFDDGTPAEVIAAAIDRMEARIREAYPKVGRIYIEVAAARRAPAARMHSG